MESEAEEMSDLARAIEYWRDQRGLSQAALSQKAGLASSGINDIIKNPERSPRLSTVESIAAALDVTLAELLGGPRPGASVRLPVVHGGVMIFDRRDFTRGEVMIVEDACASMAIDAGAALVGEIQGFDSMPLGFVPGNVVIVAQAGNYDGRVVVVEDSAAIERPVTLRYSAPPWLIGFRGAGDPYHEFAGREGLRILGEAIHLRIRHTRAVKSGASDTRSA